MAGALLGRETPPFYFCRPLGRGVVLKCGGVLGVSRVCLSIGVSYLAWLPSGRLCSRLPSGRPFGVCVSAPLLAGSLWGLRWSGGRPSSRRVAPLPPGVWGSMPDGFS